MSEFTRAVSRSSVEAFPLLLEITHAELTTPIRLTNFGEDVISQGVIYNDVPFDITLPDLARNEQGQMNLTIAAFAVQIRGILPTLSGKAPLLTIRRVWGEDPDIVEQEWVGLKITGVNGQGNRVTLSAVSTVLHESRFPDDVFDSRWPGAQESG